MPVTIVIADDHGILRGGLRLMLSAEPGFEVVGEAADGYAALKLGEDLRPNVLLADISMPGPSGIEVARVIARRQPDVKVIILTMHEDEGLVREAREAGARGFVAKRAAEAELITAVRVVAAGEGHWPLIGSLGSQLDSISGEEGQTEVPLTTDELGLLSLMAHAQSNSQIARELGLPYEEAEARRTQLMRKLGLRTRVDVIRYAHAHRLT